MLGFRESMRERNRMHPAAGIIALAAVLNAAGAASSLARQPDGADWIGKRVVQKNRDFVLKVEKQVVDRKSTLKTYRVEQVKGHWLWLRRGSRRLGPARPGRARRAGDRVLHRFYPGPPRRRVWILDARHTFARRKERPRGRA